MLFSSGKAAEILLCGWSLELYEQANARLYRGQSEDSVIIHHLITEGSADEKVLNSLLNKKEVQDELLNSLKAKYNV